MFFSKRNVWKTYLSPEAGAIFKGKTNGAPPLCPQATKVSALRRMSSTLQQNGIGPFRGRVLKETLSASWGFRYLRRKRQQRFWIRGRKVTKSFQQSSCILGVAPYGSKNTVGRGCHLETWWGAWGCWKCIQGPESVEVTSLTRVKAPPVAVGSKGRRTQALPFGDGKTTSCWLFWRRVLLGEGGANSSKCGRWSAWFRFNLTWKN